MKISITGGTDGCFLHLWVDESSCVTCKIFIWDLSLLEYCVGCNLIEERLYRLSCQHSMCGSCLHADKDHVCPICEYRTVTQEVSTQQSHLNEGLYRVTLVCPICFEKMPYDLMKAHLSASHSEVLPDLAQSLSKKQNVSELTPRLEALIQANSSAQEYEGSSKYSVPGTASDEPREINAKLPEKKYCPHCNEFWESSEIKEHIKECFLHSADNKESRQQGPPREQEERLETGSEKTFANIIFPNSSSSHIDQQKLEERKCIEDEIKKLREALEGLEERIEHLETPLRKIIQKLQAKHDSQDEGTEV